jgi:hypothetical protein
VASAPPAIAETDVRYFRPFTDAGLPPDLAVKKVAGDCFGPSMTGADPAALRCSYEDVDGSPILDPCWANIERSEVACPADPWTKSITLIAPIIEMYEDPDADGGLQTADPASDPWAMELVSGSGVLYRCIRISAYAGDVAGLRRNYACGSAETDQEEGFVFGDTDRSRDLWRVQFATGSSSELSFANVIRVWM